MTDLQLKEKIRIYLLPFKSEEFQRSSEEYIKLLAWLGFVYVFGAIIAKGYLGMWEYLSIQSQYLEQTTAIILRAIIFALFFLKKDFAHLFLLLNVGLFALLKYPQQIYAILSFSELLAVAYFIVKYAHNVGRSLFLAELNNIKINQKKTFSSIESYIGGLPVTFFLTWIPVKVIIGLIN